MVIMAKDAICTICESGDPRDLEQQINNLYTLKIISIHFSTVITGDGIYYSALIHHDKT